MVDKNLDDDENKPDDDSKSWDEFDCPTCNAHNPLPEAMRDGSEVMCGYCGGMFKAVERNGKLKLKEA